MTALWKGAVTKVLAGRSTSTVRNALDLLGVLLVKC